MFVSEAPTWRAGARDLAERLRHADPAITKQDLATAITRQVKGAPRSFNLIEDALRDWERTGSIPAKQVTQGRRMRRTDCDCASECR